MYSSPESYSSSSSVLSSLFDLVSSSCFVVIVCSLGLKGPLGRKLENLDLLFTSWDLSALRLVVLPLPLGGFGSKEEDEFWCFNLIIFGIVIYSPLAEMSDLSSLKSSLSRSIYDLFTFFLFSIKKEDYFLTKFLFLWAIPILIAGEVLLFWTVF